ncbi:uncharacterized protein LOC144868669 [Branchiostoma floridae x Branchiostoma japonicum]
MHRFLSVPELTHRLERGQDGRKFSDHAYLGTDQSKMSTSQECEVVDKTSHDDNGTLLLADIERVADEISIVERSIDNITSRSRQAAGLFWPMLSLNIHQLSEQLSSVHSALNRLGRDKAIARTLRQQLKDTEVKLEGLAKNGQEIGETVDSLRQVSVHSRCENPEQEGTVEMLQKDAVEEWLKRAGQGSTSSHHLQGAVENHLRKENERSKILQEEITAIKENYGKNVSLKVATPTVSGELATTRATLTETENRLQYERDQNKSLQEDIASLRKVQKEKDVQNKELEEEVAFLQKMLQEAEERFDAEITENTFSNDLHTATNIPGRRHMYTSLETLTEGQGRMDHSPARRSLSFEDSQTETVKNTYKMPKGKVGSNDKGGLSVSQPNLFTSYGKMAVYAKMGQPRYSTPGRADAVGQEWRQSPRVQQITADLQSKLHAAEEDLQRERGRYIDQTREINDLRIKLAKEAESKKKIQVSFAMLRSRMKEMHDRVSVEEDRHKLEKRALLQEISKLRKQTGTDEAYFIEESVLSSRENTRSDDNFSQHFVMSHEVSRSSDELSLEAGSWGGDQADDAVGEDLVADLTSRLQARDDELRTEAMKARARGREIVRLRNQVVRLTALQEQERTHSSSNLYRTRSETIV